MENVIVRVDNISQLRSWLVQNYMQKESVWLEFRKKSAGGTFMWGELVDELLCWGWIDSQARSVDSEWTSIRISPRNPKSNWSRINKEKISRLIEQGRLQPSGLAMVEYAKKSGTWNALDGVENLVLPKDFEEYIIRNQLSDKWAAKSRSFKRAFLEQLLSVKKPETRKKRFEKLKDYNPN